MVKKNETAELRGNCGVWEAAFTLKWGRPLEKREEYTHPVHKDYKIEIFTCDFGTNNKEAMARKARYNDWMEQVNRQEDPSWKKDKEPISGEYKPSGKGDYEKLLEQIEALKNDRNKPLELKQKDMQKILADIERKSQETINAINEHVEKKQEEVTRVAQELNKARDENDRAKMNEMTTLIQKAQVEMVEANRAKGDVVTVEEFKKYLEENQKNRFQSIDWKSSQTYLYLFIITVAIFLLFSLFMLIFNRIKSLFSSK